MADYDAHAHWEAMACASEAFEVNLTSAYNDTLVDYISPALPQWNSVRNIIQRYITPIVLSFGIVGNSLNLGLFGHRFGYRGHQLELLERSALAGLTALALSDLLFCVVGVLAAVLSRPGLVGSSNGLLSTVGFYYGIYQPALQNWFLFTSTWLTVVISVERFVVVGRPLKARWHLRARNSIIIYLCIYILGGLACLPLFLRNRVRVSGKICARSLFVESRLLFMNVGFRTAYNLFWIIFGHVIPTIVLTVANTRLLVVLYRSRASGIANPDRYRCTSITITVIAIVFSFLLLVCPSMVLDSMLMLSAVRLVTGPGWESSAEFRDIIAVTNLMQAVKFSANFLLYCGVLKQFRKTINEVATCQRNSRIESLRSSIKPTPL